MLPAKPMPQHSIAPFSDEPDESLVDTYAHHDLLRGAGPVFWLECHGIYGAAQRPEIWVALSDLSRRRRAWERSAKQEDVFDRSEVINSSSSCRFSASWKERL
jgi:hypothetical protein